MRILLTSSVLFVLTAVSVSSAFDDIPRSVASIVEELGMDVPVGMEFHCGRVPGNPLLYSYAEDGTIVQIGVRIFSEVVRESGEPAVFDCIERTWLELLLCDDVDAQRSLLNIKRIRMTVDGFPLGSRVFPTLAAALDIIQKSDNMDFKTGKDGITVSFYENSETTFRIILPADRSVIFPFDKKENEDRLYKTIAGYDEPFRPERLATPAFLSEEGDYMVSGGRYFMIDSLSNNAFYRMKNGSPVIVCNSSEPSVSLRNMAMGTVPESEVSKVTLNIRFKSYDSNLEDLTVTLSHFLACMQSQGLDCYSGDMPSSGGSDRVLLVFHHPVYQYIDMLVVSIPGHSIFPDSCALTAEFTAFIPQNNIKFLFGK